MIRDERIESIKRDEEDCLCQAKELWKEPCDIGFLLSEMIIEKEARKAEEYLE